LVAESIKLKTDIDRLAWYKGLSPREREIFISAARPIMEAIVNTWEEKIAPVIAMVGDGISKAVDMWAEAFLAAEDSDELPAEPGDDIRRDRHHGYNDDGILESEE
jgi:hypothetical protein